MRVVKAKNKTIIHETPRTCDLEEHHFVRGDLREHIEKKAYELYQCGGCLPGRDLENWLEAERLVTAVLVKK